MARNLRTIWAAVMITCDYKFFANPQNISEIHTKVAKRILTVCKKNSGLYIKFGQGINAMNHVLPREYTDVLYVLQDKAPYVDITEINRVFMQEFGKKPEELFSFFDPVPGKLKFSFFSSKRILVASASIAQVHKAVLLDGKTEVAVKIQKPALAKQFFWDFVIYKASVKLIEVLFDLPLYWAVEYTEQQLKKELVNKTFGAVFLFIISKKKRILSMKEKILKELKEN